VLVAIPLFERFTALDAVGPYEVLQRVPSIGVVFVGHQRGEVRSDNGMPGMMVDKTFGELTQPDVVDWVREAARSTWRSGWWSHLPQRIITAAARRQAFLPGPRCPGSPRSTACPDSSHVGIPPSPTWRLWQP